MTTQDSLYDAHITIRSNLGVAIEIRKSLSPVRLQLFRETCFGRWLDIECPSRDPTLVHTILQTEIVSKEENIDYLKFLVGGQHLRFGREEFLLITGLRFGPNERILGSGGGPFRDRIFPKIRCNVLVGNLRDVFQSQLEQLTDHDAIRICLLYLLVYGFLGRELKSVVEDHFLRLVEDLELWNAYPWGCYIWDKTFLQLRNAVGSRSKKHSSAVKPCYSLSGFIFAFKIWIYEVLPYTLVSGYCKVDRLVIPRALGWKKCIHFHKWADCVKFVTTAKQPGCIPLLSLVATDHERATDWWMSSIRYIVDSGHNFQPSVKKAPVASLPRPTEPSSTPMPDPLYASSLPPNTKTSTTLDHMNTTITHLSMESRITSIERQIYELADRVRVVEERVDVIWKERDQNAVHPDIPTSSGLRDRVDRISDIVETMNENGNDSSRKKKGEKLDCFAHAQKKTKLRDGSSSSSIDLPSQSENDPSITNIETQETVMKTESSSGGSTGLQYREQKSHFEVGYLPYEPDLRKSILNYYTKKEYQSHLISPLNDLRNTLIQGLEVQGVDENEELISRDFFTDNFEWLTKSDVDDSIVLRNAIRNDPSISHSVQRDLINACSEVTTRAIVRDIGDDYFAILVDEYSDVSNKEQIALCVRYVNKEGDVVERFLGIMHVKDTTALSFKDAIRNLLVKHSLSSSKIRGQSYNSSSNMKGDVSGLKSLIREETQSAYHVHCFAHQLELTFVVILNKRTDCCWIFYILASLIDVVGVSWKIEEIMRNNHFREVAQTFKDVKLEIDKGLNHYKLILNVIAFYPVIREMLTLIGDISSSMEDRLKANVVCYALESFESVFMLHVMKKIFGVASELNIALQRKEQDIANVVSFVKLTKKQLQILRDGGWGTLLSTVTSFCCKNGIEVPKRGDVYVPQGRKEHGQPDTTNIHHFQVKVFYTIIDLQLQDLNERFDEVSMELLVCMASLSPVDAFCSFDKQKLLKLAKFYPNEFSSVDLLHLDDQLDNYICDMKKDERFMGLKDLGELSKKLVKFKKHGVFNHVYSLIKLVMILPVATASVEKAFSAMTFVKDKLRNREGNQLLNDRLVTYVEKDVFMMISNEDILDAFKKIKTVRVLNHRHCVAL